MKIITISIANRIDRPPGGRGGERETRGAVDKSALIRWRLGSAGGTNESVQKRNASSSNPICARLGWAWRRAARSTANPDPPPPSTTRKIEDRGGWLRPMKRREASRTARQRWIENYCSHGLHANWIIKFSASVVSASARPPTLCHPTLSTFRGIFPRFLRPMISPLCVALGGGG